MVKKHKICIISAEQSLQRAQGLNRALIFEFRAQISRLFLTKVSFSLQPLQRHHQAFTAHSGDCKGSPQ